MKVNKVPLEGCYEIQPPIFSDHRGKFVKIFHSDMFEELGLCSDFSEAYYSISSKNVLRGLHFQEPPYDHVKCVTCISGRVFDVVVDLRKDSKTYKKSFGMELSANKGNMLYIPKGFAHGFYAITDDVIFLNRTSTVYNAESEAGIQWNTIDINWPCKDPIVSEKDSNLISLEDYISPF